MSLEATVKATPSLGTQTEARNLGSYHCPNKRSMIMKEDGIVDNASSTFESLSISESDDPMNTHLMGREIY
ncbi:hypothetical protein CR513_02823, partial [Mucuna pruriens]